MSEKAGRCKSSTTVTPEKSARGHVACGTVVMPLGPLLAADGGMAGITLPSSRANAYTL